LTAFVRAAFDAVDFFFAFAFDFAFAFFAAIALLLYEKSSFARTAVVCRHR
jgi:hypothetical protein